MKFDWAKLKKGKTADLLKRYKYVFAVIAAGVLLVAWPSGEKTPSVRESRGMNGTEENFSVDALEERLSLALSKIEGAGEVSVVLTVRSGMERVLATDRTAEEQEGRREMEERVVVIDGDGGEEVLLICQRYPTFQGALIVCRGGDDPQVRLKLTEAVSALTGLGTDRITVCKGS